MNTIVFSLLVGARSEKTWELCLDTSRNAVPIDEPRIMEVSCDFTGYGEDIPPTFLWEIENAIEVEILTRTFTISSTNSSSAGIRLTGLPILKRKDRV